MFNSETNTIIKRICDPMPMELEIRITAINLTGSVRAIASVCINDSFVVKGVKVVDGRKGRFLAMPSYKRASTGEYKSHCFPCTPEFHAFLRDAVFEAYQQTLSNSGN